MKFKTRNSFKRHILTKHPGMDIKIQVVNENSDEGKQMKQKES